MENRDFGMEGVVVGDVVREHLGRTEGVRPERRQRGRGGACRMGAGQKGRWGRRRKNHM